MPTDAAKQQTEPDDEEDLVEYASSTPQAAIEMLQIANPPIHAVSPNSHSRPTPVEPEVGTAQGYGYSYDEEGDEGFAASGMTWDAESNFPYCAEQEGTSVLARMVRMVSSVASSGLAQRYAPLSGALGFEGNVCHAELEQKWRTLEELVPGLTHGALILGQVEQAGYGTVAQVSAPLPECEGATYSTTVDERGCVTSCWVNSDMPKEAPARIEVVIPGAGAGGEDGSAASSARLVFLRDSGAQQLAQDLADLEAERAGAGGAGGGGAVGWADEDADNWLAPGRPWSVSKENHVGTSFIFEPALPLGSIVTKVQHGKVLVLGEFYAWEVLEMMVRFTAMFLVYAVCVFFFLGIVFEDRDRTPQGVLFLLLATKSQDNLTFYTAFLLQIIFLYFNILTLRKAHRLVRASALDELMPVKGFLVCVGYHRTDGTLFGKSLAASLSQGGVSVWCEEMFAHNACLLRPQIWRAARQACFQVSPPHPLSLPLSLPPPPPFSPPHPPPSLSHLPPSPPLPSQVVIITPHMLSSPSSCLHLLEALQRPASRSVLYLDPDAALWQHDGLGRPLRHGHAQLLVEALTGLGMRVVTCPKKLILHVDSLMLNPLAGSPEERVLSEWWSRAVSAWPLSCMCSCTTLPRVPPPLPPSSPRPSPFLSLSLSLYLSHAQICTIRCPHAHARHTLTFSPCPPLPCPHPYSPLLPLPHRRPHPGS
jgi:hypothetical protein